MVPGSSHQQMDLSREGLAGLSRSPCASRSSQFQQICSEGTVVLKEILEVKVECRCDKSRILFQSVQRETPRHFAVTIPVSGNSQSQSISDPCMAEYSRQGLVGVAGPKPCPRRSYFSKTLWSLFGTVSWSGLISSSRNFTAT